MTQPELMTLSELNDAYIELSAKITTPDCTFEDRQLFEKVKIQIDLLTNTHPPINE